MRQSDRRSTITARPDTARLPQTLSFTHCSQAALEESKDTKDTKASIKTTAAADESSEEDDDDWETMGWRAKAI